MRVKNVLFKLLGLLLISGSLAVAWLMLEWQDALNQPVKVDAKGLDYTIRPGMSFTQVAQDLAARGILDKPRYLAWAARWTGKAGRIKAGEYLIPPGKKAEDLLDMFVLGNVIHYGLTLVEGWTFHQVMDTLNAHADLAHTLQGLTNAEIMQRLGLAETHPEGRFLPETYRFPRGATDADFLRRAHQDMTSLLQTEWEQRDVGLPLRTPYEALILASIVEKETGRADERAKVAGVFIRRLRKNMRLQTDPTILYGLGQGFDGNIRRRDLKANTPYNTYIHKGLPPTPIAMPGAEAIRAALHPEEGEALYFVANGDGGHYFSATLEEHNKAVARYLLKRRKK